MGTYKRKRASNTQNPIEKRWAKIIPGEGTFWPEAVRAAVADKSPRKNKLADDNSDDGESDFLSLAGFLSDWTAAVVVARDNPAENERKQAQSVKNYSLLRGLDPRKTTWNKSNVNNEG